MLSVEHITKKYKNFTVLEDINLTFENGVYGLIAPNGAGKTTLIKMIVTLLRPTEGVIRWDGEDVWTLDWKFRELVGYLPQQFGYYRNYSPRAYLRYIAALKGLSRTATEEKIPELLSLVSLTEAADKKMKKFSGGMIQRVGIAQALLNEPKLLILDEPTAGLDPKERAHFRNLLAALSRDCTVIISTHIVSDVESIANQVIMLKDHRVLHQNTIDELCDTLTGCVFETTLDDLQFVEFEKEHQILSQRQDHGKSTVRFIDREHTVPDAVCVPPNLEDIFLSTYEGAKA